MAHRSIIVCDACGAEGSAEQGPYPSGWMLVCLTEYDQKERSLGGTGSKKSDNDLCLDCVAKWKAFWTTLKPDKRDAT